MAKRVNTNKSSTVPYYTAISILLIILVVLLAYIFSNSNQKTVQKTEIVYLYHNYSAAIAISIHYSPYMHTVAVARLYGPGANASLPLVLGYDASYVQLPANSRSSAPICLPGEVCPMAVGANSTQLPSFVLRVYENETIKTGANGTQISTSINVD